MYNFYLHEKKEKSDDTTIDGSRAEILSLARHYSNHLILILIQSKEIN